MTKKKVSSKVKLSPNERIVKRLVLKLLRAGCSPGEIRISGIQNPRLKVWASRKGVIWDRKQKVDIIYPEEFEAFEA